MTTLNDWDNGPSPCCCSILHSHKLGYHDVPEDDCPACRVDRGAALLDERRPGWWEDVDVRNLQMWDECRCVLGQVWGDYFWGLDNVFYDDDDANPTDYGFDSYGPTDSPEYARLTELWRSKINERRAR